MTDCPNGDIRDLLPDLLHGRLGAVERTEVEAHLRTCADCRDELELLRRMRSALRRAPALDVDAIVAGLPGQSSPVRRLPSRSWEWWRVAAAVTLLAAGGTPVVMARHGAVVRDESTVVAVGNRSDSPPRATTAKDPVIAAGTSREGPSAPRELALAAGTIADLDDSELSALIDDIGTLSAVTPADVDDGAAASPIAPSSPGGTNN